MLSQFPGSRTAKASRQRPPTNPPAARHRLQQRGTTPKARKFTQSVETQATAHQKVQKSSALITQAATMPIRFLMRYLANNEKLIQQLADSYPMRRAAQLMVAAFYRTKAIARDNNLHEMSPERFKSFVRSFKDNVSKEIENAKQELKKK
jgi:mediator of RNA polymerase II transcription subunit 9